MPAAANAASAVPARGRQVVSCGIDRGFLAAGGVDWVAGQAVGAIAPSEKPVAGADAAWAMDGHGMDTSGRLLRCGARLSCGSSGTAGESQVDETAEKPNCRFSSMCACRLAVTGASYAEKPFCACALLREHHWLG